MVDGCWLLGYSLGRVHATGAVVVWEEAADEFRRPVSSVPGQNDHSREPDTCTSNLVHG